MLAAFSLSLSALGGPINVLLSVDQTVVCEGTTVSVTLTASDPDPILEPDPCMDTLSFTWTLDGSNLDMSQPTRDADGLYQETYGMILPVGVHEIIVTADDGDTCLTAENDNPVSSLVIVTVVKPDIDTDSNDDGIMNDDEIEEDSPGRLLACNGDPELANLSYLPSSGINGIRLGLELDSGVETGVYLT